MMKHPLFLGLLVATACAFSSAAATFHVAPHGNDDNPGTEAQPFRTVSRGVSAAMPGDIVLIGPGEYAETVSTERAGTEVSRIVIDGQDSASIERFFFAHPYVTLQNIRVSGVTGAGSSVIYLRRGAHYSIIRNVMVDAALAQGVFGISWQGPSVKPFADDAASHCLVIGSRVTGILGTTAISVYGDTNRIVENRVYDCGQADFIRLWGRGSQVADNLFSNNYQVAGVGNHIDFIQTFGDLEFGSRDHVIERNLIMDVEGQFSQLSQDHPDLPIGNWTFRNNIAIRIAYQASCTMPGNRYYNNLFYQCNYGNGGHALTFGGRNYDDNPDRESYWAHGTHVFNNVFLDCGSPATNRGWYAFATNLVDCVANHNYVAKSGYLQVRSGTVPIGAGTHSNFRFYEPNGINGGNPRFRSLEAFDFRLLEGSPLIGRGAPVPADVTDFDGIPRPQGSGVDIGPFEYLSAIPVSVPGRPTQVRKEPE